MDNWYAIKFLSLPCEGDNAARYSKKHWLQIAKLGITFFGLARSTDCSKTTCPSPASNWDTDLAWPLAGGSSAKSTYWFALICSTNFFDNEAKALSKEIDLLGGPSLIAPVLLAVSSTLTRLFNWLSLGVGRTGGGLAWGFFSNSSIPLHFFAKNLKFCCSCRME